jgi:hypothetical protein
LISATGGGFVMGNRIVPLDVSYPVIAVAFARWIAAVMG